MNIMCGFALLLANATINREFCDIHCDGRDPALSAPNPRQPVSTIIGSRDVVLFISDVDNMGFAELRNGLEGDELWLDRSFNGGLSWAEGALLGHTRVPAGGNSAATLMYNVDETASRSYGALRACCNPTDGEVVCTEWVRTTNHAETPIAAAATALMQYWDGALWHTIGWWNSANALSAMIHYMRLTGDRTFMYVVEETYENNLEGWDGNFTSDALDDTEWWALAWLEAYDLTGEQKYLDMAILDADYIYQYVDNHCGGGVWWNIYKTYKNAITNELYITLAAALHNRIPGDTKFLHQAIDMWYWFRGSGMINDDNMINDGITDDCRNNGQTMWTYNQGVILGGLVELHKATGSAEYLNQAIILAEAVMNSSAMSPNGVLREPCENPPQGNCDCNQISFKGIYMRHFGELNRYLGNPYGEWVARQGQSNWDNNRNALNQFGIFYTGPFADHNAGTQQSSMEAFTAAILSPPEK